MSAGLLRRYAGAHLQEDLNRYVHYVHEFADIPPRWRLSLSVLRRVLFARLKAARLCTDLWLLHTRRREIGTVAGSRWWKDKGSGAHWRVASRRMFSATRVRR